jgi:putative membrane protein
MDEGSRDPQRYRTDLAEDRTLLASERTFAGWARTSLGCIAIGIGFNALFARMHPPWVPKAIASLFLLLSIVIVWLAAIRAAAVTRRLGPHVVAGGRKVNVELIATTVSLGALALVLSFWFLRVG